MLIVAGCTTLNCPGGIACYRHSKSAGADLRSTMLHATVKISFTVYVPVEIVDGREVKNVFTAFHALQDCYSYMDTYMRGTEKFCRVTTFVVIDGRQTIEDFF